MNKYSCVIVDDELQCVEILEKMLEKYFGHNINIIGKFINSLEAMKFINQNLPDILFTDVEMPRLNGIDMVNALNENNTQVVFTTAYSKYAIDAIKASATDYLVKPFGKEDLTEAVERCIKKIKLENEKISFSKKDPSQQNFKVNIHLSNGTIQFIDSSEIMYIMSQSNYSHFIFKNKPKLVVAKTLKEFDEMLTPHGFFRTHHSYLVNLAYVDHYKGGTEDALVLTNGDVVYISRRRKQDFLEAMK